MLKYIIILGIAILLYSCADPNQTDGACGDGSFYFKFTKDVIGGNSTYVFERKFPYDTNLIYYRLNNNKAEFSIAYSQLNVCSKKHAEIQFQVYFQEISQPVPFKVYAEIFWSFFGDEYILVNGTVQPSQIVTTKFYDIGLKQAFPDKPADFDVIYTIEFDDQGSTDANIDYFTKHIREFTFITRGDNHFEI